MEESSVGTGESTETKGGLWKLQAVLLAPTEAFRAICRQPNWLLPLLLAITVSVGVSAFLIEIIGLETIIRRSIEASPQGRELSREEIETNVQRAVDSRLALVLGYAGPALGPPIILPLTAGLFMLVLYLTGAESSFKKVFSVLCHTFFVYYLIVSVLSATVVLLAPDPQDIDIQNLVHSNLGILADQQESPVLFTLLASFDLITFYHLYLIALGLSLVSLRSPFAKSAAIVVVMWLVYVGGKVGLAAVFSS